MTFKISALSRSPSSGRTFWSVVFGLCLVLLVEAVSAQEIPKIRIGIEFNSPPLSYVEADGTPQGFTPELLRAMEATGRVEFEIVPQYWSNILAKFKTGELDALANVQLLADRRETMEFSIPHASLHGVTYTRPGVEPVTATAQFAGKKMAMLSGTTSQRNAVEKNGWGAQIVIFKSWQTMLQSVQDGECDFALVLRALSFEQPDELGLHRAFVEDIVYEFRIAVHRDDHVTLERINDALAEVREGGIFRELNSKWIGPIEPQPIRLVDLGPYYFPVIAVLIAVGLLLFWQRHQNQRLLAKALELQASQDMLNDAGRIAHVGGWELDLTTNRVFWSDETCRLHAVEPGAAPRVEEAINFYAPEYRPIVEAAVRSGIEQGTSWDLELELIDANGRRFWARAQGAPESENGKVVKLRGAFQDIDERKRSEQVRSFLAETSGRNSGETFFQALARFLAQSLQVDYICVDRLLGDQLSARTLAVWCDGQFEDNVTYFLADTPCGQVVGQSVCCFPSKVTRLFPQDQALQDLKAESYIGITLFDHLGQPIGLIAAISRKPLVSRDHAEATMKLVGVRAAGELERMNDEHALNQSLREKEALLKEVHHRVKNNMQVISSLLRLETAKRTDPETKAALRDMQGRIRSMALLHETLYRSGDFARVDLSAYLRELSLQFFRALNIAPHLVALGFELSAVKVQIDQAIPCGLIVNELLTNALKYGFPEGRSGKVVVGVLLTATGDVQLQVSDDGVGLPPDLDIMNSKSLGLRLVSDLTRQLQGELEIGAPAQFTIRFKPKVSDDSEPPFAPPDKDAARHAP